MSGPCDQDKQKQILAQLTVQLLDNGSIGFVLYQPLSSVQERLFLVGLLMAAANAAGSLPLTSPATPLMLTGVPIPNLRGGKT